MIKNIVHTFGHKLLIVLSNFLVVVLTSRILGSEGRGETNLLLTDFSIVYLFSGIIAGTSISYFSNKKDLFTMSFLGYVWSCFASLILVPILSFVHPNSYSVLLFGISLIQSFTMVNQKILLGRNDLFSYNINTAIQPVVHLLTVFLTFYFSEELSVGLFMKSFFFSSVLAFIVSFFQCKKYILSFKLLAVRETFKDMIVLGIRSNYDNIFETLNYRAGIYFLFWFGYQHAVGELSNSIALAEGTWLITNSLALVLYAHCLQSEDESEKQTLTLTYVKLCFIATLLVLIVLIMMPTCVYVLLFGKDFTEITFYIFLLFPGVLFLAVSNIFGHYLAANGDYFANNVRSTLGLVIVVMLLFIFIPVFGTKGAAIATSISYTFSSFYLFYHYFKTTSTPMSDIFRLDDLKELWRKRITD